MVGIPSSSPSIAIRPITVLPIKCPMMIMTIASPNERAGVNNAPAQNSAMLIPAPNQIAKSVRNVKVLSETGFMS